MPSITLNPKRACIWGQTSICAVWRTDTKSLWWGSSLSGVSYLWNHVKTTHIPSRGLRTAIAMGVCFVHYVVSDSKSLRTGVMPALIFWTVLNFIGLQSSLAKSLPFPLAKIWVSSTLGRVLKRKTFRMKDDRAEQESWRQEQAQMLHRVVRLSHLHKGRDVGQGRKRFFRER